jgi:hypothetical protein
MQKHPLGTAGTVARFVGAVFGFVFAGIGLTVIGFMWFGSDGFGSPPAFFKIIASFIALAFIAMGGSIAISAIVGGGMLSRHGQAIEEAMQRAKARSTAPASPPSAVGYACPHCGGTLGEKADVSPMGDTKCAFCGRWFNVHRRT